MRKFLKTLTLLLLLLVLVSAGAVGAAAVASRAPDRDPDDPFFRVERGDSVSAIAARLEERGFLRSRLALKLYARLMGTDGNLQVGYYRIPAGADMRELHDLLLRGEQYLVTVTIPEGYTLRRMAPLLAEKGITTEEEFLAAARSPELLRRLGLPGDDAEGYLFPDTYRFALETPAENLIEHMVGTLFRRLDALNIQYQELSEEELRRKIILASIVEREYRVPEEAPLIASVFMNRLRIGMPLQSCATVVYVLTEELDRDHPTFLTYRDLEVDSAFNTYQHYGLPPAPICNPGPVALQAAFEPAESEYLYFLVEDPEAGRHRFTTTLSEHNAAKRLYIKGR